MNKFSYGNFDSTNEDIAFASTSGYDEPGNELNARKQLSYPLKEVKTYINNTVPVNLSDNVLQLVVTEQRLKYRTEPNGALTDVPGCIPSGGTTGQTLVKASSSDASVSWTRLPEITYGTSEPSQYSGRNGDVYILYED